MRSVLIIERLVTVNNIKVFNVTLVLSLATLKNQVWLS